MGSYPLLSQAPTPVEVELGCNNMCFVPFVIVYPTSCKGIYSLHRGVFGSIHQKVGNSATHQRKQKCSAHMSDTVSWRLFHSLHSFNPANKGWIAHSCMHWMDAFHSFRNGMEASHSWRNGMEPFHSWGNGMSSPFLKEWIAYFIPGGMDWAFHSCRNGVPFYS